MQVQTSVFYFYTFSLHWVVEYIGSEIMKEGSPKMNYEEMTKQEVFE